MWVTAGSQASFTRKPESFDDLQRPVKQSADTLLGLDRTFKIELVVQPTPTHARSSKYCRRGKQALHTQELFLLVRPRRAVDAVGGLATGMMEGITLEREFAEGGELFSKAVSSLAHAVRETGTETEPAATGKPALDRHFEMTRAEVLEDTDSVSLGTLNQFQRHKCMLCAAP